MLSCGLEISRVSANIDPSTFSTASPGRVTIGSKAAGASSSSWRLFLEEGLSSRMSFLAVESPENDNLNAFTKFPSRQRGNRVKETFDVSDRDRGRVLV